MEFRDSCSSRRPVADLLRWSMGSEPRYGKDYAEYETPKNPAQAPRTAMEVLGDAGRYLRSLIAKAG